ncbi:porin [Roseibium aggregatum]|uniref:Porin n=1 Tax=Roseibium aggregatum TaxID=187304 RepID=A0A939EBZ8_9HYPH|nr:porin [Roseibium aggregatum]MBN9669802.1 porin [Roseibium aggregatum]
MKLKSLMLGAAAAAAATTAQAADLPVAPEPVDYVRICDAYGARFYYIPGTETCLRVGGRVRAEIRVNNVLDENDIGATDWGVRNEDGYFWRSRGYARLDARTATEFGTLRTYVSMAMQVDNGNSGIFLEDAFIQWGGLLAGREGSNFDIYTGQAFMGVVGRNWSDHTVNQVSYTAAFGNGFSATLALEDRSDVDGGSEPVVFQGATTSITNFYGGTRMPDVVAALAVSQGWGSAQLSGALHHVYQNANIINAINGPVDSDDEMGWAIGAGVNFNLPMLSSGSNIFFQGFYADGATAYLGFDAADYGIGANGGTDLRSGYALSAGIYYQATPTIGLALDGSYAHLNDAGNQAVLFADEVDRWAIDGSVQWEPVSGLALGVDVGYSSTDAFGFSNGNIEDGDELLFGVRMQRTF